MSCLAIASGFSRVSGNHSSGVVTLQVTAAAVPWNAKQIPAANANAIHLASIAKHFSPRRTIVCPPSRVLLVTQYTKFTAMSALARTHSDDGHHSGEHAVAKGLARALQTKLGRHRAGRHRRPGRRALRERFRAAEGRSEERRVGEEWVRTGRA